MMGLGAFGSCLVGWQRPVHWASWAGIVPEKRLRAKGKMAIAGWWLVIADRNPHQSFTRPRPRRRIGLNPAGTTAKKGAVVNGHRLFVPIFVLVLVLVLVLVVVINRQLSVIGLRITFRAGLGSANLE